MITKSTAQAYGAAPVVIHWLSAFLIVVLLVYGFGAEGGFSPMALRVHASAGIAVLILTMARIAWWVLADSRPEPPEGLAKWQARMAKTVHALFYVVILGMATSGIGMLVLSGVGPILFADAAWAMPDFGLLPTRLPHGLGARLLVLLLILHTGAAVYHQFVKRDGLLRRMGMLR